MKVPHHGSAHQDPAFLDAVGASTAITSVGAGNTYGHPSAQTLAHLAATGARSFRTDQDGDVALVHRGGRLEVVARHGAGTAGARSPPAPAPRGTMGACPTTSSCP